MGQTRYKSQNYSYLQKKREKEVLHINQVHPGTEDGRV